MRGYTFIMQQTQAPRRVVTLEQVSADSSAETLAGARALLREYGQFIRASGQVAGFCFSGLEEEIARVPLKYTERGGGCLIARADGVDSGFVCWLDISSDTRPFAWELKRLWVRPEARGLSLGRKLMQAVLDRAADAGCRAVYLDTVPAAMKEAHRLYLDMGFIPCPHFNYNVVTGIEYLVKHL